MAMRRPGSRRLLRLRRCCSCRRRCASLCGCATAEAAYYWPQGLLALALALFEFTGQPSSKSKQADRMTNEAIKTRLDVQSVRWCVPNRAVVVAQHVEFIMTTQGAAARDLEGQTTCRGPIGRSVPSLLGLLARLLPLPLPCSLWMMLSISAISRERRKPANQDRSRSAPAQRSHTLRALPDLSQCPEHAPDLSTSTD